MDIVETKRAYFALTNEPREEKREEAYRTLCVPGNDEMRRLADSGRVVFDVISDRAKPEALAPVLDWFRELPVDGFWSSLAEMTGQTLMERALAKEGGSARTELLGFGLGFIGRAQDGGFAVSESSMDMVRKAKDEKGLSDIAQGIIRQNGLNAPQRMPYRKASETLVKKEAKSRQPSAK